MIRQCAGEFSRMVSISSENLEGEVQQKAKEQADRFRLWASHIGVFATPRWSLDYRLRKSPEVSSIIVGMLEVLKFKVKVINSYLEGPPSQSIPTGITVQEGKEEKSVTSESDRTADRQIQIQELDEIAKSIGRLHRLSLSIRKASAESTFSRSANFRMPERNDGSLGADIGLRDYFKSRIRQGSSVLSDARLNMLIDLNFSRRQHFEYLAFRQKKMLSATCEEFATSSASSESIARDTPKSTSGKDVHSESRASTFDPSKFVPQPTESVISSQQSQASAFMTSDNAPRPPKIPPNCEELQCPYCLDILPKKYFLSSRRWKLHLEQDLQPYVCLYEECFQPVQAFSSIEQWVQHINDVHWAQWICPLHETSKLLDFTFKTEKALANHFSTTHGTEYSNSQAKTIVRQGKRRAAGKPPIWESCPFCTECNQYRNTKSFEKRIAGHLLDIAILSLPWRDDVEEEDNRQQRSTRALSTSDQLDLDMLHSFEDNDELNDENRGDFRQRDYGTESKSRVITNIKNKKMDFEAKNDDHSRTGDQNAKGWADEEGTREERRTSAGWIRSHRQERFYREELVNGEWVDPWDVMRNTSTLLESPKAFPANYRPDYTVYEPSSPSKNQNAFKTSGSAFKTSSSTSFEQQNSDSPMYSAQQSSHYHPSPTTRPGHQYSNNQSSSYYSQSSLPYIDNLSETNPAYGSRSSSYQTAEGSYTAEDRTLANYDIPRGEGATIQGTWSVGQLHYEKLDYSYFVRDRGFFVPGRVFSVLFTEAAESTASEYPYDCISLVRFGEKVYSQIRRFIVVKQRREYCHACPIFTYSGKATLKRGVRPAEHAVIHTNGYSPTLLEGETGIVKDPIAVETPKDQKPLQRASRIYFGIVHPVQYNVKVKDLGIVYQDDIPKVIGYYEEEQMKDIIPHMISSPNTSRV